MKFEDRSQEEIERHERCARGDTWRLRVLQGRRPPSEKWPRANNQQRQRQPGNVQRPKQFPQVPEVQRPRRTPEETQAMAATKVRRIEAAIAALEDDDGEELASLQSCLRRARLQAQVPPVEKGIMPRLKEFKHDAQLSQTHHFIAREFLPNVNKKTCRYVDSFRFQTIPQNSCNAFFGTIKTMRFHLFFILLSACGDAAMEIVRVLNLADNCLHEMRKQIKIHNFFVVMILKRFKWFILILHHRKSRDKEGRSLRRMPRETEKPSNHNN